MSGSFQLRTARGSSSSQGDQEESDGMFVIRAFDSALPYLASIGSGAQWGTQPFSERPSRVAEMLAFVDASAACPPDGKDWKRMVVAQTGETRVAAMGLSEEIPDYVPEALLPRGQDDFVYLNYLIVDRRTGALAKGSGGDLVQEAVREAKSKGKARLLCDCWRGNGDGLMRYYAAQGFSVVGEFDVAGKHGKELIWEGYLLEIKLSS